MRKAFLPTLLMSTLAVAALCGPAAAAPPSSNSSINEYQESLPGPGGGQPSNGGNHGGGKQSTGGGTQGANQIGSSNGPSGNGSSRGGSSGGDSSGGSPLSARAVRQLAAHGASGKALSDLAQKTGTVAGSGSGTGLDTAADPEMGGGSSGFLDSVGGALSDFFRGSDTGLGAGFPILLAVALLGAVGILMTRHRRAQGPRP
jgi:hypothetical protein